MKVGDNMSINEIRAKWNLPDDYAEFLNSNAESIIMETEDYGELEIFGANSLISGQNGCSYNPVTEENIEDWNPNFLVIASAWGDPFCIDTSQENSPVYFGFHGEDEWEFSEEYDSVEEFLREWVKDDR